MATTLQKLCSRQLCRRILTSQRSYHSKSKTSPAFPFLVACGCGAGMALAAYGAVHVRKWAVAEPILAKEVTDKDVKVHATQTQRELRFLSFASVEYDSNVYMTPQDFLESVMEDAPRPRTGRSHMRRDEVERFLKVTPGKSRGSTHLFRNLHDKGLISYTEYLFLLCVLTKPRSGFRIVFNMFDTDGNQRVDKKEFLVILRVFGLQSQSYLLDVFGKSFANKQKDETEKQPVRRSNLWALLTEVPQSLGQAKNKDAGEHMQLQDTTLLVHFFGRRGNEVLKYEDFHRFMENIQTELLELEFNVYARGMPTITEEEFAMILLRYTILSPDDQEEYIKRLRERIPHAQGISFQDFKEFGQFLNNLDDFAIAMRMYTFADQPISEGEFKRAVKVCTGQNLNDHVVHTVFQLFDIDGDGNLSHKEFISVMKDRLHRGFKSHLPSQGNWDEFKSCVKSEIKYASN